MKLKHSPFAMIALGGALGALSRFYLSIFIDSYSLRFGQIFSSGETNNVFGFFSHQIFASPSFVLFFSVFPFGVLVINMLGSLVLGILLTYMQYAGKNNIPLRNFIIIGFLGSFTTFSTFIMDSLEYILPLFLQSTLLQEIFPHLQSVGVSFENIFPLYSKESFVSHSFSFALINIFLNIFLCLLCVCLGHGFMKKRYTVKK